MEQPKLTILEPERFWSRTFLAWFVPVAALAAAGVFRVLLAVLMSGSLAVPFWPTTTLEAMAASKGDLLVDEQMQRLLEQKHIRVHLTRSGSRAIAHADYRRYDFMFPSGRPAAKLLEDRITRDTGHAPITRKPFTTMLVLASFREYADTLVAAGAATAQPNTLGGPPLYYTLNMAKFFALVRAGKTWDGLGIGREKIANGNVVLAHSSNPCESNSGETYAALAALVLGGRPNPPSEAQVPALVGPVKEVMDPQGIPDADLWNSYITPEGRSKAPIAVVYEHQYLSYQLGLPRPDTDRVLLYPDRQVLTDPEYISITQPAETLGDLLADDPGLRRREMELGFRVGDSGELWDYLRAHGIPAPDSGGDLTKAELPVLPALEKLVTEVGACPDAG